MPNGHDKKEYGSHSYLDHNGTSDCIFKCGCWAGPSRSGGPVGIDPFGKCPANPLNGEILSGKEDHRIVVEQRIRDLENRAFVAERLLRQVEPGTAELVRQLNTAREENFKLSQVLKAVVEAIKSVGIDF